MWSLSWRPRDASCHHAFCARAMISISFREAVAYFPIPNYVLPLLSPSPAALPLFSSSPEHYAAAFSPILRHEHMLEGQRTPLNTQLHSCTGALSRRRMNRGKLEAGLHATVTPIAHT